MIPGKPSAESCFDCGGSSALAADAPAPAATPTVRRWDSANRSRCSEQCCYSRRVFLQHSSESEARRECIPASNQYKANKATNANGGLNWIERGGGDDRE